MTNAGSRLQVPRLPGPRWVVPRWAQSIKFRLALTYAVTVYAVGSILIGAMYAWQVNQLDHPQLIADQGWIRDNRNGQVYEVAALTTDTFRAYLLEVFELNVNLMTIENLKRASLVGLLLLVVVAFIIGWILATITLRPINRMVAVARDISGSDLSRRIDLQGHDDELRRLADTFDAMLDRLQNAFEDQRRFVQDASHELRNPLAVARTNLELAMSNPEASTQELRRSVEVAHRSTGRMSDLVDDLLVQARSGVPQIEQLDVDLASVADDVRQQFLGPARERSITIDRHTSGIPVVRGDEQSLNRVVTNLVSNALRFAPAHTAVEVGVTSGDDGFVELSVADHGPGLSAEDAKQVFTRFWRGRNAGTGSGLGLSIVKQVVERHGGTVAVTSTPGEGATFVVRLPRSATGRGPTVDQRSDERDPSPPGAAADDEMISTAEVHAPSGLPPVGETTVDESSAGRAGTGARRSAVNSEFERFGDNDPTTPMFEGLLPQPTDEMARPSWEPAATPAPFADSVTAAPPVHEPSPPPPRPQPAQPQPQHQPQPPQPRPLGGGPTAPNYAPAGAPVPPPPIAPKAFTPSSPPKPPAGPGQKPAGEGRLSRWGWRSLVAFVAGGLVAAGGFAAGEINGSVAAPGAATTPTSIVVRSESAGGVVEEPASLVAQLLGPSVVQIRTDFGLGSGVIYRDGYILTNNHVIEDAQFLSVRLSTGETFDAELVGSDPSKDVAVLSVGERDLPVADLALDTPVRVGQVAVAIGSPFDLQQTVTAGIVSAVNRPVPSRTPQVYVAMIQTDAPINPGNSGGALADRDGRVIGINTAIQTDGFSGTNAGVGFAIPIVDAVRIADLLVSGEPIEPGFLGVSGQAPEGGEPGVEIVEVTDGSAAAMAGIEIGDRVLSLDEAPVTSITELAGLVLARQAGDEVNLRVVRDGVEVDIGAVLGARP